MYYYVSGSVAHVEPYLAVIDCGGVGYACRTTAYTLSQIKKGEKAKLFTYLSVREDAMDLYGFASQEELKLFQQLVVKGQEADIHVLDKFGNHEVFARVGAAHDVKLAFPHHAAAFGGRSAVKGIAALLEFLLGEAERLEGPAGEDFRVASDL